MSTQGPACFTSLQNYDSLVHFSLEYQCPSSAVVSFSGSEEEVVTDNSMSLTALDAEDWACS